MNWGTESEEVLDVCFGEFFCYAPVVVPDAAKLFSLKIEESDIRKYGISGWTCNHTYGREVNGVHVVLHTLPTCNLLSLVHLN